MRLGPVRDAPFLNSFFGNRSEGPERTEDLRQFLTARSAETPLVLVTHQVNITTLTGHFPRSGELVFVRRGPDADITMLGTIGTR